jgi:transcriptional regulator with XRE-family HTH domain
LETLMDDDLHFGALIRQAREAKGLSREALARQLNIPLSFLEGLESGRWDALPAGRERPLARQVAERLGVDPSLHAEAWDDLPGEWTEEEETPGQDKRERVVMAVLAVGTLGLIAWLILPGPRLRKPTQATIPTTALPAAPAPKTALPAQPFPVLGEAIPEAPRTEEGILVVLRTADRCEAHVSGEGLDLRRTLQVSEPWKFRVKGAFALELDNAGVVTVQVAGQIIRHGQSVGEGWKGRFDDQGLWQRPLPPKEPPPTTPDTEIEPEKGDD